MKKVCLLLSLLLLIQFSLCSCSENSEDFQEPVNFYYGNKEVSYNSASGVIRAEKREGANYHGNLDALLKEYLLGPISEDFQNLIPADVYLVSCDVADDVVNIVFSGQFSKLTGVKLTTACSAILMTIHDFTGAHSVRISARDSQLDGKNVLVLTMDDIVLLDIVSSEE